MSVAESLAHAIDAQRAKKSRWDTLISLFLKLPAEERREFTAKLVTLEFDDGVKRPLKTGNSGVYSLFPLPPDAIPTPPVNDPPTGGTRDWEAKPRYRDLIRASIQKAGQPLTAHDIVKFAATVRPGVKKTSMETVISRMAQRKELKRAGTNDDGLKLYDLR